VNSLNWVGAAGVPAAAEPAADAASEMIAAATSKRIRIVQYPRMRQPHSQRIGEVYHLGGENQVADCQA